LKNLSTQLPSVDVAPHCQLSVLTELTFPDEGDFMGTAIQFRLHTLEEGKEPVGFGEVVTLNLKEAESPEETPQ
jgi:hypothetical protein